MIYKLTHEEGQIDWCTATDVLHLLKSYDEEHGLTLAQVKSVEEITPEEATKIMLTNTDYNEDDADSPKEIALSDLAIGEEFCIVGSSEWI